MNNRDRPAIDQESKRIWQRCKDQKSLSSNVFERLDRYKWEKMNEKQ